MADLGTGVDLIARRWPWGYTQVWRTHEFTAERGRHNHFGSLTLFRVP